MNAPVQTIGRNEKRWKLLQLAGGIAFFGGLAACNLPFLFAMPIVGVLAACFGGVGADLEAVEAFVFVAGAVACAAGFITWFAWLMRDWWKH